MKTQLRSVCAILAFAVASYGQAPQPKPLYVPKIITVLDLQNMFDQTPPVILFTPISDGLFRMSVNLETAPRLQPLNLTFTWVDPRGNVRSELVSVDATNGGSEKAIVLRLKSGTPVYYSFDFQLGYEAIPLPQYDASVIVERLTSQ